MVAALPASEGHLNTSLSMLDLIPASPEFGSQQVKSEPTQNLSAAQSDCAAELVATLGRLLAAASSTPGPQRKFSKVASEKSPALICIQARPTVNRGLPLDSMHTMLLKLGRRWMHRLYVPCKASWSSLGTRLGPVISRAMSLRVSARILRTTRETLATARAVLRHWRLGFIHDWKITVNAIDFHKMKKSFVRWLQQPISSNR